MILSDKNKHCVVMFLRNTGLCALFCLPVDGPLILVVSVVRPVIACREKMNESQEHRCLWLIDSPRSIQGHGEMLEPLTLFGSGKMWSWISRVALVAPNDSVK